MAEEVTYADLKFMTLRQTKKQQEEGGIRDKASPLVSHRWRLAAAILGIFCVALLGASGALSFKVLQVHRIARRQNENLTQQREMVENLLTTLSVLQDRNLNLSETVQQLSNKGSNSHRCSPCPERWIQHGENCYYLSTKWNSWEESKVQCATLNSRLLKIESKEELAFVLESNQANYAFWIGLIRRTAGSPWLWEDNSTFPSDLFKIPEDGSSNYPICVSIQGGNLIASDCLGYRFCMCEKVVSPA